MPPSARRVATARLNASSIPMTARSAARDEALLDRRVFRDRAVPVEMVRRDVEEDADRRLQAWCEVDLKRRHLNDMDAVARGRLKRQDRRADVAAHLHVAAGLAQDVGDERRRRRLAVGAGDGDERRVGRKLRALAAEQLDVADDLDAGGFRQPRRPVRLGMGQRHAGREDQRRKARPVRGAKIGGLDPLPLRPSPSPRRCRRRRRPAPRRFSAPAPSPAPSRRARTARRCGRRRWWRGSCGNRWRTPALLILRCERSEPRRTHPDKAAPTAIACFEARR